MKIKTAVRSSHVGTAALGCPVERSSTAAVPPVCKLTHWAAVAALLLAFSVPALSQDARIPPDVEKLSAKAKETVEVTMDGPMLHWASKFLSAEDPEEAKCAKLVANLKGIYVRSFEFDKDDAYSAADVEALRSQFRSPTWSRVVGVRSDHDGDNVDIFFKLENEKMAGIVIIAAEARELTYVNIVGPLEVDQLADLGGEFGIPKLSRRNLPKSENGDRK